MEKIGVKCQVYNKRICFPILGIMVSLECAVDSDGNDAVSNMQNVWLYRYS